MSLINDALKRANEQKARQVTAGELGEELKTVDDPSDLNTLWPIGIFALCLVGSMWFAWAWWRGGSPGDAIHADTIEVAARTPAAAGEEAPQTPDYRNEVPPPEPAVAEPVSPKPVAAQGSPPPSPRVQAPAPVPAAARPSPSAVASAVPAPPKPQVQAPPATFPVLTLQGIYYRPSRPSVVINSRTLQVGDEIAEARILAIDRKEVTVQWRNEIRVIGFQ